MRRKRPAVVAITLFVYIFCLAMMQGQSSNAASPAASPYATPSRKISSPGADKPGFARWSFAVSGDSRNCGNVVMPAIAASAKKNGAAFYWHLGDLRAIFAPDEDYGNEPEHRGQDVDKETYLKDAWPDFISHQIRAFEPLPFYLGIGNHELIAPKTRTEFENTFAPYLDAPVLREQRLKDKISPEENNNAPRTFYHWIQGGIDFIYLDNADKDQFDAAQLSWLHTVLERARIAVNVHGVIVGMHEALPESLASAHSMNAWPLGIKSGEEVYRELLDFRTKTSKPVYVLASHSHFYMTDIFESDYWRTHGGVLPGFIIGTAGAVRYPLPATRIRAKESSENSYGYLLVTVTPSSGKAKFKFKEIKRGALEDAVGKIYPKTLIDFCVDENSEVRRTEMQK